MDSLKKKLKNLKRMAAFVLAMVLLITMHPTQVEAYIGAIRDRTMGEGLTYKTFINARDQREYASIENDYIHFDFCVRDINLFSKNKGAGKIAHTIPMALLNNCQTDLLDSYGAQEISHQIATPADLTIDLSRTSFASLAESEKLDWRNLNISAASVVDYGRAKDKEDSLLGDGLFVKLKVTENREMLDPEWRPYDPLGKYRKTAQVTYYILLNFELVKLDRGDLRSKEFPNFIPEDDSSTNGYQNWGVHSVSRIIYDEESSFQQGIMGTEGQDWYRMNMTFKDFAKMGHANVGKEVPSVMVQMMDSRGRNMYNKNISAGMDTSKKNLVSEVYVDDFGFGMPFVAGSNRYNYWSSDTDGEEKYEQGAAGHVMDPDEEGYARHVTYSNYNLTVEGHEAWFAGMVSGKNDHHLWGFRDILSKSEVATQMVEPDVIKPQNVKISENAKMLYVIKKGSHYEVVDDYIPPEYVASYYGVYKKIGALYQFYGGALKLSPSINMTWNTETSGNEEVPGATMTSAGELRFDASKVSFEAPSFVFYQPADDAQYGSVKFKGYDVPGEVEVEENKKEKVDYKGIALEIDPEKNAAIFNIDLPGNGVNVTRANIDTEGNIVFAGELNINLFVAGLDMQELSYGGSGDDFGVNGINAKGFIDTEKFSILGFEGGAGRIEGEVNTFEGREKYAFSFELEVEDLFETEAELELRRLKNGQLCPNKLYADFGLKNGAGIDITPSTPVVTITGAGLGAYNIADTVEQYSGGNVHAIPPVLLRATANGKVCKALEGKLNVYVGPSKLGVYANDLSVKDFKFIDELGAEFYVQDAELDYKGDHFKGYTVGGASNLQITILPEGSTKNLSPSVSWFAVWFENFLSMTVHGDIHSTVAEAYVPRYKYQTPQRKIYGCTSVSGLISTKVDDKSVFGYQVGTDIATRFSLQSVTWDDATASAFTNWMNNLELTGGFAADVYAGDLYAEAKYVIKQGFDADAGVDGNRKYIYEILDSQGAEVAEEELSFESGMQQQGDIDVIDLGDGTYVVAVYATNTNDIPFSAEETEETLDSQGGMSASGTISIDADVVNANQNLILVLTPDEDVDDDAIDEMVESVSVDLPDWKKFTKEDLTVSDNSVSQNTISVDDKKKLTVWAYKNFGEVTKEEDLKNVVYVSVKNSELPASVDGKYTFNVSADRGFQIKPMTTNPVIGLSASVNDKGQLVPKIENRQAGKDYTIETYYNFVDEEGKTSTSLISSQEIESGEEPEPVALPDSGLHVATGDYTVCMQLLGGKGASVDDEGNITESTLTLPISTVTEFGHDQKEITIHYTNDNDQYKPGSPYFVKLEENSGGNGVLDAYWTPVSDADGYQIKLYQKDKDGNFVDTDRGYSFSSEQLQQVADGSASIDGLSYGWTDYNNNQYNAYKLQMAVTAYGVGGKEEDNGQVGLLDPEEELKTDQEYQIGVFAYKKAEENLTVDSVSANTASRQILGDEEQSPAVKLHKPDCFDFDVDVSDGEITKDSEKDVYKYRADANAGGVLIIKNVKTASGEYLEDYGEQRNGSIEITYYDPEKDEDVVLDSAVVISDEDYKEGDDPAKFREYWFSLPNVDGLTQIEIKAKHEVPKDSLYGVPRYDETIRYVAFENDNIAPVVGVDENEITPEKDGSYTVCGVANSGADIYVDRVKVGTAGDDGTFKVTVKRSEEDSEYINICAMDEFANESQDIIVKLEGKPAGGGDQKKDDDPKDDSGKNNPTTPPTADNTTPKAQGETLKDTTSKAEYVVTSKAGETPAVTYKAPTDTKAKNVTVPKTITVDGVTYQVTSIADNAFKNNKTLQSVKVEEGVTSIGNNAFAGCVNLKSVTVPGSVTKIGNNAFKGCKNLTKVKMGKNVTEIGNGAFAGCKKLKSIKIGAKVKKLGKQLFKGDSNLKTITIQTKLLTAAGIKKGAFKGLGKKVTIKVPKAKKKLYTTIFRKKGLPKAVRIK